MKKMRSFARFCAPLFRHFYFYRLFRHDGLEDREHIFLIKIKLAHDMRDILSRAMPIKVFAFIFAAPYDMMFFALLFFFFADFLMLML